MITQITSGVQHRKWPVILVFFQKEWIFEKLLTVKNECVTNRALKTPTMNTIVNTLLSGAIWSHLIRLTLSRFGGNKLFYLRFHTSSLCSSVRSWRFRRFCVAHRFYSLPNINKKGYTLYLSQVNMNSCFLLLISLYTYLRHLNLNKCSVYMPLVLF